MDALCHKKSCVTRGEGSKVGRATDNVRDTVGEEERGGDTGAGMSELQVVGQEAGEELE